MKLKQFTPALRSVSNLRLEISTLLTSHCIDNTIGNHSVKSCFTPLLILSCLWLIKIVCCRVKNSIMHLAIAISVASMAFAFESHFDNSM